MSRGFRFQSATVIVNTSITKSLVIVLSKCLLLVQFCLAHVFIPDIYKARAVVVLRYRRDKFPNLCLLASWIMSISGQIILPLSAHSVLWQISCPTSAFPWATTPSKTPWLCPETIPFRGRKKGRKLSIVRWRYISANTESPRFPLKQTRSRNWWWTRWRWPGQWRRTLSRRINGF